MVIYLSAPSNSVMEREYIDNLVSDLCMELCLAPRSDFYIPHQDCGDLDNRYINNIKYLNESDLIIAVLDGNSVDSGTAFEIGFFAAQEKPVIGFLTDERYYDNEIGLNLKLNEMIFGLCDCGNYVANSFSDLVNLLDKCLIDKYYGE